MDNLKTEYDEEEQWEHLINMNEGDKISVKDKSGQVYELIKRNDDYYVYKDGEITDITPVPMNITYKYDLSDGINEVIGKVQQIETQQSTNQLTLNNPQESTVKTQTIEGTKSGKPLNLKSPLDRYYYTKEDDLLTKPREVGLELTSESSKPETASNPTITSVVTTQESHQPQVEVSQTYKVQLPLGTYESKEAAINAALEAGIPKAEAMEKVNTAIATGDITLNLQDNKVVAETQVEQSIQNQTEGSKDTGLKTPIDTSSSEMSDSSKSPLISNIIRNNKLSEEIKANGGKYDIEMGYGPLSKEYIERAKTEEQPSIDQLANNKGHQLLKKNNYPIDRELSVKSETAAKPTITSVVTTQESHQPQVEVSQTNKVQLPLGTYGSKEAAINAALEAGIPKAEAMEKVNTAIATGDITLNLQDNKVAAETQVEQSIQNQTEGSKDTGLKTPIDTSSSEMSDSSKSPLISNVIRNNKLSEEIKANGGKYDIEMGYGPLSKEYIERAKTEEQPLIDQLANNKGQQLLKKNNYPIDRELSVKSETAANPTITSLGPKPGTPEWDALHGTNTSGEMIENQSNQKDLTMSDIVKMSDDKEVTITVGNGDIIKVSPKDIKSNYGLQQIIADPTTKVSTQGQEQDITSVVTTQESQQPQVEVPQTSKVQLPLGTYGSKEAAINAALEAGIPKAEAMEKVNTAIATGDITLNLQDNKVVAEPPVSGPTTSFDKNNSKLTQLDKMNDDEKVYITTPKGTYDLVSVKDIKNNVVLKDFIEKTDVTISNEKPANAQENPLGIDYKTKDLLQTPIEKVEKTPETATLSNVEPPKQDPVETIIDGENGTKITRTYDKQGRITEEITEGVNGDIKGSVSYTYNADGSVEKETGWTDESGRWHNKYEIEEKTSTGSVTREAGEEVGLGRVKTTTVSGHSQGKTTTTEIINVGTRKTEGKKVVTEGAQGKTVSITKVEEDGTKVTTTTHTGLDGKETTTIARETEKNGEKTRTVEREGENGPVIETTKTYRNGDKEVTTKTIRGNSEVEETTVNGEVTKKVTTVSSAQGAKIITETTNKDKTTTVETTVMNGSGTTKAIELKSSDGKVIKTKTETTKRNSDGLQETTTITQNSAGLTTEKTTIIGESGTKVTTTYDEQGRITAELTDGVNGKGEYTNTKGSVSYKYNEDGSVEKETSWTDENGNHNKYEVEKKTEIGSVKTETGDEVGKGVIKTTTVRAHSQGQTTTTEIRDVVTGEIVGKKVVTEGAQGKTVSITEVEEDGTKVTTTHTGLDGKETTTIARETEKNGEKTRTVERKDENGSITETTKTYRNGDNETSVSENGQITTKITRKDGSITNITEKPGEDGKVVISSTTTTAKGLKTEEETTIDGENGTKVTRTYDEQGRITAEQTDGVNGKGEYTNTKGSVSYKYNEDGSVEKETSWTDENGNHNKYEVEKKTEIGSVKTETGDEVGLGRVKTTTVSAHSQGQTTTTEIRDVGTGEIVGKKVVTEGAQGKTVSITKAEEDGTKVTTTTHTGLDGKETTTIARETEKNGEKTRTVERKDENGSITETTKTYRNGDKEVTTKTIRGNSKVEETTVNGEVTKKVTTVGSAQGAKIITETTNEDKTTTVETTVMNGSGTTKTIELKSSDGKVIETKTEATKINSEGLQETTTITQNSDGLTTVIKTPKDTLITTVKTTKNPENKTSQTETVVTSLAGKTTTIETKDETGRIIEKQTKETKNITTADGENKIETTTRTIRGNSAVEETTVNGEVTKKVTKVGSAQGAKIITETTNPDNTKIIETEIQSANGVERIVETKSADGQVVKKITEDKNGKTETIYKPNGTITEIKYDASGNKLSEVENNDNVLNPGTKDEQAPPPQNIGQYNPNPTKLKNGTQGWVVDNQDGTHDLYDSEGKLIESGLSNDDLNKVLNNTSDSTPKNDQPSQNIITVNYDGGTVRLKQIGDDEYILVDEYGDRIPTSDSYTMKELNDRGIDINKGKVQEHEPLDNGKQDKDAPPKDDPPVAGATDIIDPDIDIEQLKKDVLAYIEKTGVSEEEATEACKKILKEKTELEKNKKNILESENKEKINKAVEKKTYIDGKLKDINDLFGNGNLEQVKQFKEFLINTISKSPLLNIDLSQYSGESAEAYKRLISELKEKTGIIIENANVAEVAAELIEKQLIPALKRLVEIDEERDPKRLELEKALKDYDSFISKKPSETISVEVTIKEHTNQDGKVVPEHKEKVDTTNEEYTKWLKEKKVKDDNILILTEAIELLDKEGEELKEKCLLILGKEDKLDALIKEFKNKIKNPKVPSGSNNPPPGGDNKPPVENPPTEPGIIGPTSPTLELPDNTQEQLNYYKELSINELHQIFLLLDEFCASNNITIQELLFDKKNCGLLCDMIESSNLFKDELRILVKDGNQIKTQQLFRDIFMGKQNFMGISDTTASFFLDDLNTIANEKNITVQELLSDVKYVPDIKNSLSITKDIVLGLKDIPQDTLKDQLIKIYDGDGVDNYNENLILKLRKYADDNSANANIDIINYLNSDSAVTDYNNLGKVSVILDTIQNCDDEKYLEALNNIIHYDSLQTRPV